MIELLTGINIVVVGIFSFLLWDTNKKLGEKQLQVQKDNIKLQMFDKRYDVYRCLVEIDSTFVYAQIATPFKDLETIQQFNVNLRRSYYKLQECRIISKMIFDNDKIQIALSEISHKFHMSITYSQNIEKNFERNIFNVNKQEWENIAQLVCCEVSFSKAVDMISEYIDIKNLDK